MHSWLYSQLLDLVHVMYLVHTNIGKDSSVMVRLAEKAFAPRKVPFPLMHIDSKWKFKEMIQFRDEYAKKYGWNKSELYARYHEQVSE